MKLKDFVSKFIEPNSVIRLWKPIKGGHEMIANHNDDVCMNWEITDEIGIYKDYINNEVKGVTDILMSKSNYMEAINITIII